MNIMTEQQETLLENAGFVATDNAFLYTSFDDVIKGNIKDFSVASMQGDTVYCENEQEFIQELLGRIS